MTHGVEVDPVKQMLIQPEREPVPVSHPKIGTLMITVGLPRMLENKGKD